MRRRNVDPMQFGKSVDERRADSARQRKIAHILLGKLLTIAIPYLRSSITKSLPMIV